jgi:phosphoglycerate dehydrogenase-like enzyme
MLPDQSATFIQFAHPAYRLSERFALTGLEVENTQAWDRDALARGIADAHVLVLSGFWDNALLEQAGKLAFIQVCAAGYDQFDLEALRGRGIRLCNASGVNANAVSEHAVALMLALLRKLHTGRDNQRAHHWRGMISELDAREDELPGKTVLVFGAGTIGGRIARLCRAFDTHVIGVKRNPAHADPAFHEVHPPAQLASLLPRADVVILSCPLNDQTRNLMNAATLAAMKPSAYLINVARGGCVDEPALVQALANGQIAGAGIDVTVREPLPGDSPLWDFENVIVTPHTGGETRAYEDRVVDILADNLKRLWRGETQLRNQIV